MGELTNTIAGEREQAGTMRTTSTATTTAATPRRHTMVRLFLALVIGALVGVYAPGPEWVSVAISAAAVLLVALLSLPLDRALRTTGRTWLGITSGIAAVLVVIATGAAVFWATGSSGGGLAGAGALLAGIALLVTVVAGFSVGAASGSLRTTWGLALGTGLAAWIGVGLRNLLPLAVHTYTLQDPEGFAVLGLIITAAGYVLIGVPVALLGGTAGRRAACAAAAPDRAHGRAMMATIRASDGVYRRRLRRESER